MTKEKRVKEKVIKVDRDVYISANGREFESEDDCKSYEKALKEVVNTEVLPMFKRVTELNLFNDYAGSEEYDYGIIKVTSDNYDKLKLFIDLNHCYNMKYDDIKFTEDYIDKTVLFGLGYGIDTQNNNLDYLTFCGSTNEWYMYMINGMCKALQLD